MMILMMTIMKVQHPLKKYCYVKGPIIINEKPNPPNWVLFDLWLEDFFKLEGLRNYEVWLSGGFLAQRWKTYDIDITLVGELVDLKELANVMI